MNNHALLKAFAISASQLIAFKIILIIYLTHIPWPQTWPLSLWCAIIADIVLPLTSGFICCLIVQKRKHHNGRIDTNPKVKFFIRLLAIMCVLLMGVVLEKTRSNNLEGTINFLIALDLYSNLIFDILFNLNAWLVAALFPFSYAVAESAFLIRQSKRAS